MQVTFRDLNLRAYLHFIQNLLEQKKYLYLLLNRAGSISKIFSYKGSSQGVCKILTQVNDGVPLGMTSKTAMEIESLTVLEINNFTMLKD